MKNLVAFTISLVFLTCNSSKTALPNSDKTSVSTTCPEDGICTFEVLENKSLNLKKDGIGALYPELSEGYKTVIKFEYKRHEIPNTADSGYSEIVYAEIDPSTNELNLQNEALMDVKMVFGRLCFCRGATGYYPIQDGVFKISPNKDGSTTYELHFKIHEVPQIITMFQETQ